MKAAICWLVLSGLLLLVGLQASAEAALITRVFNAKVTSVYGGLTATYAVGDEFLVTLTFDTDREPTDPVYPGVPNLVWYRRENPGYSFDQAWIRISAPDTAFPETSAGYNPHTEEGLISQINPAGEPSSAVSVYRVSSLEDDYRSLFCDAFTPYESRMDAPYTKYRYSYYLIQPEGPPLEGELNADIVSERITVDIKPSAYPNVINLRSNGKFPVAILSSGTFDAADVDPGTVRLAGANAAVKNKGKVMSSLEDVNGDGHMDLVCRFNTQDLDPTTPSGLVKLTGTTFDGQAIEGSDEIVVLRK